MNMRWYAALTVAITNDETDVAKSFFHTTARECFFFFFSFYVNEKIATHNSITVNESIINANAISILKFNVTKKTLNHNSEHLTAVNIICIINFFSKNLSIYVVD